MAQGTPRVGTVEKETWNTVTRKVIFMLFVFGVVRFQVLVSITISTNLNVKERSSESIGQT